MRAFQLLSAGSVRAGGSSAWRRAPASLSPTRRAAAALVPAFFPSSPGAPAASFSAPVRFAGALQALLRDRDDPFLALTQELDLAKIAALARRGPAGLFREDGAVAAEPPLSTDVPADASEDGRMQHLGRHLRSALCSINAVLRVEVMNALEKVPGATAAAPDACKIQLPVGDLDAGWEVFHLVQQHREIFSGQQWEEDIKPELKDFETLLKWTDDPRVRSF